MKPATWTKVINCAALGAAVFAASPAHAAMGSIHKDLLSVPSSGDDKGKYASASLDAETVDCKYGTEIPNCFRARATITGKVMNAAINAVAAGVDVANHRWTDPNIIALTGSNDMWFWSYYLDVFGTSIFTEGGSLKTSEALTNAIFGQPLIDQEMPFTKRGVQNLEIDLKVVHGALGILPNAKVAINYGLNGGTSTRLEFAPKTAYGPLLNLDVQPRASMTASFRTDYEVAWGSIADAAIWTTNIDNGNKVQVLGPYSSVKLNASYAFGTRRVNARYAIDAKALKGRIAYEANAAFSLINITSGNLFDSLNKYAYYHQYPDKYFDIYNGVL